MTSDDMHGVVPDMGHEDKVAILNSIIFTSCLLVLLAIGYRIHTGRLTKLPKSGAAMIIGFVVGCVVRIFGLREEEQILDFNGEFFFYVLLPPIIFEAGLSLETRVFVDNLGAILAYAVVGSLVSTWVVSNGLLVAAKTGLVGLVDGQRLGVSCYLFGALISATDPVATIALFAGSRFRTDPLLVSLINGESVLNDAVAIVLFSALEQHLDDQAPSLLSFSVLGHFVLVSIGSLIFGLVAGATCSWCFCQAEFLKGFPDYEIGSMCLSAYLTFAFSQFCGLSGIVSLFFFGVVLTHYNWYNLSEPSKVASKVTFRTLAMLSEACVFVYLGVVVALSIWRFHWHFSLAVVAMVLCIFARAANIFPLSAMLNAQRSRKIPQNMQIMMWLSGLRGAIAFALSLRIPCQAAPRANRGHHECQNSDLLVTTTITIVFVSTMILGTAMENIATALNIIEPEVRQFNDGLSAPLSQESAPSRDGWRQELEESAGQSYRGCKLSLDELRVNTRGHLYQAFARFDLDVLQNLIGGPCRARVEVPDAVELPSLHSFIDQQNVPRHFTADEDATQYAVVFE